MTTQVEAELTRILTQFARADQDYVQLLDAGKDTTEAIGYIHDAMRSLHALYASGVLVFESCGRIVRWIAPGAGYYDILAVLVDPAMRRSKKLLILVADVPDDVDIDRAIKASKC